MKGSYFGSRTEDVLVDVISHIKNFYGFEVIPSSIPRNNFQYFKRYIYLFIMNNISEKLFYFLRDKVSPIKFLKDRPEGDVWLYKYSEGRIGYEVRILPIPPEAAIYNNGVGNFIPQNSNNFKVTFYKNLKTGQHIYQVNKFSFNINDVSGISIVDINFCLDIDLKSIYRDKTLENILS